MADTVLFLNDSILFEGDLIVFDDGNCTTEDCCGVGDVQTDCCEAPIPATLYGTVSNAVNCCASVTGTLTAVYGELDADWRTADAQQPCFAYLGLRCGSGPAWEGAIGAGTCEDPAGAPFGYTLISAQCDPLEIVIDYTSGSGAQIRVTWTA